MEAGELFLSLHDYCCSFALQWVPQIAIHWSFEVVDQSSLP